MHLPLLNGVFKLLLSPSCMRNDHVDIFSAFQLSRRVAVEGALAAVVGVNVRAGCLRVHSLPLFALVQLLLDAAVELVGSELFEVRNRLPLVFMLLCLSPVSYHHCAAGCRASCYLYLVPHADVPRRMSCPRTTTELPHHRIPLRSRPRTNVGRVTMPIRKVTAEPPRLLLETSPNSTRSRIHVAPHVPLLSTPSISTTARHPPLRWPWDLGSAAALTPAPAEMRTDSIRLHPPPPLHSRWAHSSAIWLLSLLSPVLPEASTSPSTPRRDCALRVPHPPRFVLRLDNRHVVNPSSPLQITNDAPARPCHIYDIHHRSPSTPLLLRFVVCHLSRPAYNVRSTNVSRADTYQTPPSIPRAPYAPRPQIGRADLPFATPTFTTDMTHIRTRSGLLPAPFGLRAGSATWDAS